MVSNERLSEDGRGQVGVELLVVFIATVIAAAIAASLLLNTAIALQSQAVSTAEESVNQVTDRVQVVSAWGEVGDDETLDTVTLRVRTSPGAGSVDLSSVSVRTVGDGVDANRSVEVVDSEDAVLTEGSDIGYVHVYGESGLAGDDGPTAGDRVAVHLTTSSGATTVYVVDVPDTLAGKSVVEL